MINFPFGTNGKFFIFRCPKTEAHYGIQAFIAFFQDNLSLKMICLYKYLHAIPGLLIRTPGPLALESDALPSALHREKDQSLIRT